MKFLTNSSPTGKRKQAPMSLPMQHIIRHLFRVETLEEVPRQQLEELVEEYPSFGVGRYLLSRKLQAEAAGHFGEEKQTCTLPTPYGCNGSCRMTRPTIPRKKLFLLKSRPIHYNRRNGMQRVMR